jgi:hypothetical protein
MTWLRVAVYRLYDVEGRLLYIGQAPEPRKRVVDHTRRQPWGSRIDHMECEWFTNRPDALVYERALTLSLNPEFPTIVTGEGARFRAIAQVVADLRHALAWYGEPVPDDKKARARELLEASGYLDDATVTPREKPTSNSDPMRVTERRMIAGIA